MTVSELMKELQSRVDSNPELAEKPVVVDGKQLTGSIIAKDENWKLRVKREQEQGEHPRVVLY